MKPAVVAKRYPFLPQLQPVDRREFVNPEVLQLLHANPALVRELEKHSPSRQSDQLKESGESIIASMSASFDSNFLSIGRPMRYAFGHKRRSGRQYAKLNGCLQRTFRFMRHALCHSVLRDWDLKNSYFSICSDLCRLMGVPCPLIDDYVANRMETLARIGLPYDEGKQLLLSYLLGKSEYATGVIEDSYQRAFDAECAIVRAAVMAAYPEEAKKKAGTKNQGGKTLSEVLGIFENGILKVMVDTAEQLGICVSVLMLDGFMSKGTVPDNFAELMTQAIQTQTPFTSVQVLEKEIPFIDLQAIADAAGIQINISTVEAPVDETATDDSNYMPSGLLVSKVGKKLYYILQGPMNSGKTKQLMELIAYARARGWSICVATQRRAMVDSYSERVQQSQAQGSPDQLYRYDQIRGIITPQMHPHVVVEWESIARVEGVYDLIVVDEARSVIETMNSNTNGAAGAQKESNLNCFSRLCKRAQMCLFMDADISVDGAVRDVVNDLALATAADQALDAFRAAARAPAAERDQALAKAAALQLVVDSRDASSLVETIKWDKRAITRNIRVADPKYATSALKALVKAGERVGVCMMGRAEAQDMRDKLDDIAPGSVTVYFGGSKNLSDVRRLNEMWDKYQVIIFNSCITTGADYKGAVHSVFAFPRINTNGARDMHQMIGRFRQVSSSTVWMAVTCKWYLALEEVTLTGLCELYIQQLLINRFGKEMVGGFTEYVKDQLAEGGCVLPQDIVQQVQKSMPLMQKITAYSQAERKYTETGGKWLSYFKYMAEMKGYGWQVDETMLSKEDAAAHKQEAEEIKTAREMQRDKVLASIQVDDILQDQELFDNLQALGAGRKVKGNAEVMKRLEAMGITSDNLRDAALKAKVASELTEWGADTGCLSDGKVLDFVHHNGKALLNQRIIRSDPAGDMAPIFQDTYEQYTTSAGTVQVSPLHVITLCGKLARAMGLKGLLDDSSPVYQANFNMTEIARALRDMTALHLCKSKEYSFSKLQGIFKTHLGLILKKGECVELVDIVRGALAGYPAFDAAQYFQQKHGKHSTAVSLDKYTNVDNADELASIRADMGVPEQPEPTNPFAVHVQALITEASKPRWEQCRQAVDTEIERKRAAEQADSRESDSVKRQRIDNIL